MFNVCDGNYKSYLLEIAATYFGVLRPEYFHFEYGPHHAKVFLCICIFNDKASSSKGRTKVEAEQFASRDMLEKVQKIFFEQKGGAWILSHKDKQISIPPEISHALEDLTRDLRFDIWSVNGEAVLRYFIVRYLFDQYAQFGEGILTRIASEALREETRATIAHYLSLTPYIRTEPTPRVLAETLNRVVGKLAFFTTENLTNSFVMEPFYSFIDCAVARILSARKLDPIFSSISHIETNLHNSKNELQDYAQKHSFLLPNYLLVEQGGAAHDPTFMSQCHFKDHVTIGHGKTKKAAEQNAAQEMLRKIHKQDVGTTRTVGKSASYSRGPSRLKRFNAPELYMLKRYIGWHHFENLTYLTLAFTHPSQNSEENYQSLEFLGDAILKKILAAHILKMYPEIHDKGRICVALETLISAGNQAKISNYFNLDRYLFSLTPPSQDMLSDVLEALIAAIYLDAEVKSDNQDVRQKDPEGVISSWFQKDIERLLGKPSTVNETKSFLPPAKRVKID